MKQMDDYTFLSLIYAYLFHFFHKLKFMFNFLEKSPYIIVIKIEIISFLRK